MSDYIEVKLWELQDLLQDKFKSSCTSAACFRSIPSCDFENNKDYKEYLSTFSVFIPVSKRWMNISLSSDLQCPQFKKILK